MEPLKPPGLDVVSTCCTCLYYRCSASKLFGECVQFNYKVHPSMKCSEYAEE